MYRFVTIKYNILQYNSFYNVISHKSINNSTSNTENYFVIIYLNFYHKIELEDDFKLKGADTL